MLDADPPLPNRPTGGPSPLGATPSGSVASQSAGGARNSAITPMWGVPTGSGRATCCTNSGAPTSASQKLETEATICHSRAPSLEGPRAAKIQNHPRSRLRAGHARLRDRPPARGAQGNPTRGLPFRQIRCRRRFVMRRGRMVLSRAGAAYRPNRWAGAVGVDGISFSFLFAHGSPQDAGHALTNSNQDGWLAEIVSDAIGFRRNLSRAP